MTKTSTTARLLLSAALTVYAHHSLADDTAGQHGTLTIEVNAAASDDGFVDISLLNSNEQFSGQVAPQLNCRQAIRRQRAHCTFNDVPYGEYALFVYHDENDNHELDENFLGAPTEKLAISAVDLASNTSPTFEQSKIRFHSLHGQLFINLQ